MLALAGYEITEEIQTGDRKIVYRGIRKQDRRSVVVKVLKSEYPSLEAITHLRQEYQIPCKLEWEGIVKPYSLETYQNSFALVFEDFGGNSLKRLLATRKLQPQEVLKIAIKLADTLGYLHQALIIHKDIKPSNLLINPATGQVKLDDFAIAERLAWEKQTISSANAIEGTLAYMSPEQTGRMNRPIDYRTDFYSLGATCYEMLTGHVPFTTNDPMALVHCHIAQRPVPPHLESFWQDSSTAVSEVVSAIVMKLLAKMPEDRYQTAAGLKFDLEKCLSQFQTTGNIETFPLGERDRGNQLLLPPKLYGRETQLAVLMETLERVNCNPPHSSSGSKARAELLLISGYSGIGKTTLVGEAHQPIATSGAYFISGKFDRFRRNVPYAALIRSLEDLVNQLLAENPESLSRWKTQLQEALGYNAQVMLDFIPDVELILGPQPEVSQLEPAEAQNRLHRVLKKFIQVFCQPGHPLVLFLDDLQWADAASLQFIQMLLGDPDSRNLLTIGAYRDHKLTPMHPLSRAIRQIRDEAIPVTHLNLSPLSKDNIRQLVADNLGEPADTEHLKSLVELVFNKTQGNPFFASQLLRTLYLDQQLVYQVDNDRWHWNPDSIVDETVVELISRSILQLPETTQAALKLAACIGNQFSLDLLAVSSEQSPILTAALLWPALEAELIQPLSEAYKLPLLFAPQESRVPNVTDIRVDYQFLHDRVQQAAYSLISEAEKEATHLKIGQLLLQNSPAEKIQENIFTIVNQLNFGLKLLTTQAERDEFATLNLMAAQKAKTTAAYEVALQYLDVALGLLADNRWEHNYKLTLSIYTELAEAKYLNANFERAISLVDTAFHQTKTLLEGVKLAEIRIQSYIAQNRMQTAIDAALQDLGMFEVSLETTPPPQELSIEKLIQLSAITDLDRLAALRILNSVIAAAWIANPTLVESIIFTMVNICIEYGNSPLASTAYINYALLLCGPSGNINRGYQFGQLALRLLDRFNSRERKSVVLTVFNAQVRHWKEHLRETLSPLKEAIYSGIEAGENVYSGYAAAAYCTNNFLLGEYLEFVEHQFQQYIELLRENKQEYTIQYAQIWKQVVLNLLDRTEDSLKLIGEAFNEEKMLPILVENKNGTALFCFYLAKTILLYMFKQFEAAVYYARNAIKYEQAVVGSMAISVHNFYYSLALLAQYPNMEQQRQNEALEIVKENQQKMENWAIHAPSNFLHKYQLVEAEKARILDRTQKAKMHYENAIKLVKDNGYLQEEALTNELIGEFHLSRKQKTPGRQYIKASYYNYVCWGSAAKAKDLELRYPEILAKIIGQETDTIEVDRTTTAIAGKCEDVLNLATVIDRLHLISDEENLASLLDKLIRIAMEVSHAERGFLILDREGELSIEASRQMGSDSITVLDSIPVNTSEQLSTAIVNYVARSQTEAILSNTDEKRFTTDPYLLQNQPESVLCAPLLSQNQLVGLLYLENSSIWDTSSDARLEILRIFLPKAATSIKKTLLRDEVMLR